MPSGQSAQPKACGSKVDLQLILPAALGISLAAATGFRIFAPILIMSLAASAGWIPVSEGFEWVTTTPALLMLAVAAIAEVLAYYMPGIDNVLDTIAAPSAIVAGIAVSAAVMTDLPPMLKWTLAIIAGGGAATMTQGATTLLRSHSTALTAGLGNHVIATGEIAGAVGISILAIALPWLALLLAVVFSLVAYRLFFRVRNRKKRS